MNNFPGNTIDSKQLKGAIIRGEGLEFKHYLVEEGIDPGPNRS